MGCLFACVFDLGVGWVTWLVFVRGGLFMFGFGFALADVGFTCVYWFACVDWTVVSDVGIFWCLVLVWILVCFFICLLL